MDVSRRGLAVGAAALLAAGEVSAQPAAADLLTTGTRDLPLSDTVLGECRRFAYEAWGVRP